MPEICTNGNFIKIYERIEMTRTWLSSTVFTLTPFTNSSDSSGGGKKCLTMEITVGTCSSSRYRHALGPASNVYATWKNTCQWGYSRQSCWCLTCTCRYYFMEKVKTIIIQVIKIIAFYEKQLRWNLLLFDSKC